MAMHSDPSLASRGSDGSIRCTLCPHHCKLRVGERARCYVRQRQGDDIVLTTWGRASRPAVEPVERLPLSHFLPGTSALAFGSSGCNLACRSCGEWHPHRAVETDRISRELSPERIAALALRYGCRSVAFTRNDPVPSFEFVVDVAKACRARGIKTIAVTAGFINPEPRARFFREMDAVTVTLKAYLGMHHRRLTRSDLQPVLDTLQFIRDETDAWLEINNLLVPGENDTDTEVTLLASWIVEHLGPDTPLHFSALTPAAGLSDKTPTSFGALAKARRRAGDAGIRFAYTADIADEPTGSTYCYGCGEKLIGRNVYRISHWGLTPDGHCESCGRECAGVLEAQPGECDGGLLPLAPPG